MNKTNLVKRVALIILCLAMTVCCIPMNASAASNARTIYDFCITELGLNSAGACGVLANIEAESNFSPTLYGDGGNSYGICQWNLSRFTNLKNYCNKNGYDWKSLNGQLQFLKYELTNNKSDTGYILDKLKSVANTAQGAYDAGYKWCYYFERPANKEAKSQSRGNKAKNTYWPNYKDIKPAQSQTTVPAPTYTLGDVNNDGVINSADALQVLQYSTDLVKLNSNQIKAADVDRDGYVNSKDALIILSIATGNAS